MQTKLIEAYLKFKEESTLPETLQERLSAPLLLKVSNTWVKNKKRVLIVGQETLGWNFRKGQHYKWPYDPISSFKDFKMIDDSINAMVHGYSFFEFAKHHRNYSSPFWRAYRQVRKKIGDEIDGINTSVLWSNLFRMSLDGGSVIKNGSLEEISNIRTSSAGLLKAEIKILNPTSIIFFTGPDYNNSLYSEFENSTLIPFKSYDINQTSYVKHEVLPEKTIRTYHPGYLNRGKWDIVNQIIETII